MLIQCVNKNSMKKIMYMKLITVILILLGAILISGCGVRESRIHEIKAQYPQWDQPIVEKVAGRQVEIGMNDNMVTAALGEPDSISHDGDEEKWGYANYVSYGMGSVSKKFVYFIFFQDGTVVRTAGDWNKLGYWYH